MAGTCKHKKKSRTKLFSCCVVLKNCLKKYFKKRLKNIKKRLIPKSHCKKTVDQNLSIMKVLQLKFLS